MFWLAKVTVFECYSVIISIDFAKVDSGDELAAHQCHHWDKLNAITITVASSFKFVLPIHILVTYYLVLVNLIDFYLMKDDRLLCF